MTRILHVMAGAPQGGAERFFERLVPALTRAGDEQQALIRRNPDRESLLQDAGVSCRGLRFGGRLDLLTPWQIGREIRSFAPQIVFSWMSRASRMVPPSPQGRQTFLQVARLGGYYDLKYYQNCDYLIGDTEDIVRWMIEQGRPAERCIYLPNFVTARPAAALPRRELAVPEDASLLLGLGRLHGNKGFDTLIQALTRLPDVYLLLAGEGPERGALEELATRLGVRPRIRFLGWRDDVPSLFASCDLFVHPARHEPLGNVILEAWAQQKPIVCTAADGPAALIEQGVSGLLVPVDQPHTLAEAIGAALRDRSGAQALADAGYQVFLQNFTETAVIARYQAFFRQIVETL